MIERKLFKVESNSTERCQSIIPHGQCQYARVENSLYCPIHGGAAMANKNERQKIRNYRFQRYQARIDELADSDGIKSLREEIGVLRMVLEETINKCTCEADLLMYSNKICDITVKIERLVLSCHRLESSLGFTLDKAKVLNLSTQIVNIISMHVTNESILNNVITEIVALVEKE